MPVEYSGIVGSKLSMNTRSRASTTLIFVRHAQYRQNPEKLTALGRRQARLTDARLAKTKASVLFASTMPRAVETAGIISAALRLKVRKRGFFREAALPPLKKGDSAAKIRANRLRADRAYHFLFTAPKRGQKTMIIVAHGNVIRYWVCRALGMDRKNWLKMDLHQTSVTTIKIYAGGSKILLGFADCGHLPEHQKT
jgi:serine/threonine-protein phosphatase PGAM5